MGALEVVRFVARMFAAVLAGFLLYGIAKEVIQRGAFYVGGGVEHPADLSGTIIFAAWLIVVMVLAITDQWGRPE